MIMHRRYACHRVYDGYNHYHPQTVVSLTEKGEFIGCTPLVKETSFTQWIGGVIVLSPLSDVAHYTDFQTMLHELSNIDQTPLYAWHISDFDFAKEEFTPQSIVKRL